MSYSIYLIYALPLILAMGWYLRRRSHIEQKSRVVLEATQSGSNAEPASLHPVIDHTRCIGCSSCVKACPEQPEHTVLGIIDGKAQLVSPGDCIGHGACRTACPVDAISLVFGTERRGVEIPLLTPQFESTVPGIFIAVKLVGMGLIRNALEQGRQAVDSIFASRPKRPQHLDLVIVGAGPAGFAASLTATAHGMRFVTLEQDSLGGCVFQYPRGKLVMTQPVTLPIAGKIKFGQTSKEALLEFWRSLEKRSGLQIRYRERVETIQRSSDGFLVRSTAGEYHASSVLLAIGRRGTPRKLGVPGEDGPNVVYRLIDPQQYDDQRVLVVGGGDSALEAAASIADACSAEVTLSYRGDSFSRAKAKNRERIAAAERSGRIKVLLESNVKQIDRESVRLAQKQRLLELANDTVIVSAGGTMPTEFLQRVGIETEVKYGTA